MCTSRIACLLLAILAAACCGCAERATVQGPATGDGGATVSADVAVSDGVSSGDAVSSGDVVSSSETAARYIDAIVDVPLPECSTDTDCANPICWLSVCLAGQCSSTTAADGAVCDDGDVCTMAGGCVAGACAPGLAVSCDDGNVCSDDSCTPPLGCVHLANSATCSDGNACSVADACQSFGCVAGAALVCADSDPCTADGCLPASGCQHVPTDGPCSDGNACTLVDTCGASGCQPGATQLCDDGNPCSDDGCAPASGCVFLANTATCTDGNVCTTGDGCQGYGCVAGPSLVCDDGNVCTADSCAMPSGCLQLPLALTCTDGDACTGPDACVGGTCVGGAPLLCDDGDPCTVDTCAAATGCVQTVEVAKVCARFAVIGDYGDNSSTEADVAKMVKSWQPDLVLTVGDNNYQDGKWATIDANIGQHYSAFIKPYVGKYGPGSADINRFFPTLGNHDWHEAGATPYLAYFELPGNERYYEFTWGALHFFALDSDPKEPDGNTWGSKQAVWLQARAKASNAPFKIAYFHHAPFSSANHGPQQWMQWPFAELGIYLVIAGHDHVYERIRHEGVLYLVNGFGGAQMYSTKGPLMAGSQVRYDVTQGAVFFELRPGWLRVEARSRLGLVIDQLGLLPNGQAFAIGDKLSKPLFDFAAPWRYLDQGTAPASWAQPGFDDKEWSVGAGPFGYGEAAAKTKISWGKDPANRPITTWFRRHFTLPVGKPGPVMLRLVRDDGVRVWVNGAEALRINLPAGEVSHDTAAGEALAPPEEGEILESLIDPLLLQAGDNVIAVELHNASKNNGDLFLACGLWAF